MSSLWKRSETFCVQLMLVVFYWALNITFWTWDQPTGSWKLQTHHSIMQFCNVLYTHAQASTQCFHMLSDIPTCPVSHSLYPSLLLCSVAMQCTLQGDKRHNERQYVAVVKTHATTIHSYTVCSAGNSAMPLLPCHVIRSRVCHIATLDWKKLELRI